MKIYGIQKLTLLDFPLKVACTVFTGGCNLRCPFCHNASLVKCGGAESIEAEVEAFLKKRAGVIEGVCISGGEPLLQPDIAPFLRFVRSLGLCTKLDTNGTLPQHLVPLLNEGLLDYVAMDLKNSPALYAKTVGVEGFDFAPVAETMELLRKSGIAYEFRTTVVKGLHTVESLKEAASLIKDGEKWFLQQFVDSGDILKGGMEGYTPEEMRAIHAELLPFAPSVGLRGL